MYAIRSYYDAEAAGRPFEPGKRNTLKKRRVKPAAAAFPEPPKNIRPAAEDQKSVPAVFKQVMNGIIAVIGTSIRGKIMLQPGNYRIEPPETGLIKTVSGKKVSYNFV